MNNGIIHIQMNSEWYECRKMSSTEISQMLLKAVQNVENQVPAQAKKPRKAAHTCDVCHNPATHILNMHGSCACTVHQKCAKDPTTGQYLDHCPHCQTDFTQETLDAIQNNLDRMRNANKEKQKKKAQREKLNNTSYVLPTQNTPTFRQKPGSTLKDLQHDISTSKGMEFKI